MMRICRRSGVVSVLFMGLCTLITGCQNTAFERLSGSNGYSPPQRAGGYGTMPPQYAANARGPIQQAQFGEPAKIDEPGFDATLMPPTVMQNGMMMPTSPPLPTEKAMTTFSPHHVAPPDILLIDGIRLVPRGPYRLDPMEVLMIEVPDALPKQDIKGLYMIGPDGKLNLGYTYGSVVIGGLTIEQAQVAIRNHLNPIIRGANVNVVLVQMRQMQKIAGDHLVRPDGTVYLGAYGSVYVAGMTLGQVKANIERHLSAYFVEPQVAVDVKAYNSRKIYIIADSYVNFRQQVITLPATGNETVLDAIGKVQGLNFVASTKKIWVARPSPAGNPCSQVLPVDWKAITQAGRTETNYQLLPGDRIYIASDPFWAAYFEIDKMLAPIERVIDFTFRTATTIQTLKGNSTSTVLIP